MSSVPAVTLRDVNAPELKGEGIRGVVGIDIWEDEDVHDVKLWLEDGRKITEGRVVARIKRQLAVDYADEPRRHRLVYFQRFQINNTGALALYGDDFSYQPQCCRGGGGGCGPFCDTP